MRNFYISNYIDGDLKSTFKSGISSFNTLVGQSGRPDIIFFELASGKKIQLKSILQESSDWDDIGTLEISSVDVKTPLIPIDPSWRKLTRVCVLELHDTNLRCECGLLLENINKQQLYILPSSYPYSIEIKAGFYKGTFEPECDITQYLVQEL